MKPHMIHEQFFEAFPVSIDVPVAWGEMDAFGHVNNIVYFRYFESARIAYFEKSGFMDGMQTEGVGPILSKTSCRFKLPLAYPDRVTAGARVAEIGEDRFLMRYRVVSHHHEAIAAEGDGMVVCFDYRKRQKVRLPRALRDRIADIEKSASVETIK